MEILFQAVPTVFPWSFEALGSWRDPATDHLKRLFVNENTPPPGAAFDPYRYGLAGQEMAGGYVGAFSEMRGDQKF